MEVYDLVGIVVNEHVYMLGAGSVLHLSYHMVGKTKFGRQFQVGCYHSFSHHVTMRPKFPIPLLLMRYPTRSG